MQKITRYAVSAIALLLAFTTVTPAAHAEHDEDIWDFLGSDVQSRDDEDIWDLFGPDVILRGPTSPAFVLDRDNIFLNVGTDREPRWEQITEREFWQLIDELEDAGFELVAKELPDEEFIVAVFIIPA